MDNNLFHKLQEDTQGIDLNLITEPFKIFSEDFICHICDKLVIKPLFCKNCSVVFCSKCHGKTGLENCINCKVASLELCPILSLNLLNKFVLKCRNEGCNKSFSYSKYFLHLEVCEENLYNCLKCEYKDKRKIIEKHIEECDGVKINCEFCKMMILRKNYKDHLAFCNNSNFKSERDELISEIESLKSKLSSVEHTNNVLSLKNLEIQGRCNSLQEELKIVLREKQDLIREISNY